LSRVLVFMPVRELRRVGTGDVWECRRRFNGGGWAKNQRRWWRRLVDAAGAKEKPALCGARASMLARI
jgi:hypothetical protein